MTGELGKYPIIQNEFRFVIVNPDKREKGYGKALLCYKADEFSNVVSGMPET